MIVIHVNEYLNSNIIDCYSFTTCKLIDKVKSGVL